MFANLLPNLPQHATLRRLLSLRVLALVCQVLLALLAHFVLAVHLPWGPLALVFLVALGFVLWNAWRISRPQPLGTAGLFAQLLVDMLNWSALLYFCGGATNPFVSFYLAILAVAAAILPGRLVGILALLSLLAYALLSYYYQALRLEASEMAVSYHLAGMFLNFALSALVISWFVTRISSTLRMRDAQLAQARERQWQNTQVLALGTQAASAAHAIATPLATIAVLVGELRHAAKDDPHLGHWLEDLQLMESQIGACRQGLEQMRARMDEKQAHQLPRLLPWAEEFFQSWRLQHPHARLRLALPEQAAMSRSPRLPHAMVCAQILQTLLDNALVAAPDEELLVELQAATLPGRYVFSVHDLGQGIAPQLLASLGHAPVASSNGGQGIGLWLASVSAQQIGAELHLEARVPLGMGGTSARLTFDVEEES